MCSFNEKWGNICMNAAVCGRSLINMVCTSSLSHMRLELEGRRIGSNETAAVTKRNENSPRFYKSCTHLYGESVLVDTA